MIYVTAQAKGRKKMKRRLTVTGGSILTAIAMTSYTTARAATTGITSTVARGRIVEDDIDGTD